MNNPSLEYKAAERGVPSLIWRAGQKRRFEMIKTAAGERLSGRILENGCGVGIYLGPLSEQAAFIAGWLAAYTA